MQTLLERILAAMKGADPPATIAELTARVGATKTSHVFPRVSQLLREGKLTIDELPWRRSLPPTLKGRPLGSKNYGKPAGAPPGYGDIGRALKRIIKDNGKDRVGALNLLANLRSMGGEVSGPPPPNDRPGMVEALVHIMQAAGQDVVTEATALAFPPHDTIEPQEALNGQSTAPDLERPAAC